MLNYSEACERNKEVILQLLQQYMYDRRLVLEIGSGSGQHAIHFANTLNHLKWQPSDLHFNLSALAENLAEYAPENVLSPLELDVIAETWQLPVKPDAAFTANTLHIMDEGCVEAFIRGIGQVLPMGGCLCVYGPFRYEGSYTSESNARFDLWLKQRDSRSGIRDFETIAGWAKEVGLICEQDHDMPANNQFQVWRKVA